MKQQQQQQQQPDPSQEGDEQRTDAGPAAIAEDEPENREQVDRLAGEGASYEEGMGAASSEGRTEPAAWYSEAYADAMHQWDEYGTGPFPSDDGTGWLAVSVVCYAPCVAGSVSVSGRCLSLCFFLSLAESDQSGGSL